MPNNDLILHQPLDAVIFDCDGTLSAMEGIDVLAEQCGVAKEVKAMTAKAMGDSGLTIDIYRDRLDLVKPNREQLDALGREYVEKLTPGAADVVRHLQSLKKDVYLVSAGLYPAILTLAQHLNVPEDHVYAVGIAFDEEGDYHNFDELSPLVENTGKKEVVAHIKKNHSQIGYVGDGMNDLCVKELVERFIGFGGVYYRDMIKQFSDVYIEDKSLVAILPYLLTKDE